MTTIESKGRFFYETNRVESIRITNGIESIRIANWNALALTHSLANHCEGLIVQSLRGSGVIAGLQKVYPHFSVMPHGLVHESEEKLRAHFLHTGTPQRLDYKRRESRRHYTRSVRVCVVPQNVRT